MPPSAIVAGPFDGPFGPSGCLREGDAQLPVAGLVSILRADAGRQRERERHHDADADHAGSVSLARQPRMSLRFSSVSDPPWPSAICRQSTRPMPIRRAWS